MAEPVEIIFFIRERVLDEKFVYDLVEPLIDVGSKYNEPREELRGTKGFPATLEDQIKEVLSNNISWIDLIYKGILHYTLWFYTDDPFKYKGSRLGKIGIDIPRSALNPTYWHEISEEVATKRKRCIQNAKFTIEIAKLLWNALEPKPIYGVGDEAPEEGLSVICPTREEILNLKIEPYTFWLNFYGPEIIKKFGKDKLLSMPAYKVEELKEGIMFLRSPLPFDYDMDTHKRICDHLGWKTYYVDIFNIDKPKIREIGAYGKEFQYINALRKYLERDIDEFLDRVKGGRVFVMLETPSTKPVPEHVREMEKWLREEMEVEVKEIRW